MDKATFDRLTHDLADRFTRRGTLATLAGGVVFASIGRLGLKDAAAKRRKRRRKPKAKCLASDVVCSEDGTGKPCCSGLCCPPWEYAGQTDYSCAPTIEDGGGESECCTEDEGGGYCCCGYPVCCGDPLRERETICALAGSECCDDEFGGSCGPGFSCCDDPEPGYCCPDAATRAALSAQGVTRPASIPREFRYRSELMQRGRA
jgi:hypothetical protein